MNTLRLGIAQINVTVGDLVGNAARILNAAETLADQGAAVIIFPEMVLCGYPPEDLMMKAHFVEDCREQLDALAESLPKDVVCVIGAPIEADEPSESNAPLRRPHNSAVVISGGKIAACYHKIRLPNYAIFDEKRVFESGEHPICLQVGGARLGLHICEDSWGDELTIGGNDLDLHALINLSASPYHQDKLQRRHNELGLTSSRFNAFFVYVNLVGGQDELVFDGGSFVLDPLGKVVAQAPQFTESLMCVDIPLVEHTRLLDEPRLIEPEWVFLDHRKLDADAEACPGEQAAPLDEMAEVYEALKLGLRDYIEKNGFKEVVIAISGGIDSALVAQIAVDALGAENVQGVTMPSQYSSSETLSDAEELTVNLGIKLKTIPINELFHQMVRILEPHWDATPGLAEENIQARIRGNLIMALSNKMNYLVLATGNKSELATGYCTLYGDMCGGFAVIKDVPKMLVFDLCRWRNQVAGRELVPQTTIDRPPTAELRPDQKDSDSLPEYEVLDPILEAYVEQDQSIEAIIALGFDEELVRKIIRLVDLAEYKRRQAAPGIRISPKAFGRDRRIPITNHYRN